MIKTLLVTGATSQDTQILVKMYKDKYTFIVASQLGRRKLSTKNEANITYIEVDFLNIDAVREVISTFQVDVVIHFAGLSSVRNSWNEPMQYVNFNIGSGVAILEAVRSSGRKPSVFMAGSAEIYSGGTGYYDENSSICPETPYAASKASLKSICDLYRTNYDLRIIYGVLFNHESKLRPSHYFIPKLIHCCKEIEEGKREYLELGNLNIIRDIGLASEHVRCIEKLVAGEHFGTFNISTNCGMLLSDMVLYTMQKFNISKTRLITKPELYRPYESIKRVGDNRKLKNVIGYVPTTCGTKLIDELVR